MIKLNKLFKIEYGNKDYESKGSLLPIKNGVPLISSKGIDNGVHGFYDINHDYEFVLTVARTGTVGATFFHKYKCCADNNVLVLHPKVAFTDDEMLFYAYLINLEAYKYLYGRQVTPSRLGETFIPELTEVKQSLGQMKNTNIVVNSLSKHTESRSIPNYANFKLSDIFNMKLSVPYHKVNLNVKDKFLSDYLIYITRTGQNNGVEGYVDSSAINVVEHKNAITIGAEGCKAFYQPKEFICGNKVTVLRNAKLNEYNSLYVCSVLNLAMANVFSYGRAATYDRLMNLEIRLPIKSDNELNNPDWDFMTQYIESLDYSASI